MSETTRKIKKNLENATDAVKNVGQKAVDKASEAAAIAKEKAKDVAQATGEAVETAGKKLRRQGE